MLGIGALCALLTAVPGLARPDSAAADPAPASRLADYWVFGRSAEVFRPDEEILATRVGGWADGSYEDNDIDGARRSFRLNHLNAFLDTRFTEHWQFFFEGEYEDETDLSGYEEEQEWEIEQAYLRWSPDPRARVRAGKFNTPFGYWTPLHWSILMDTIQKPIHEGNRVIPEQPVGGELSGRFFPEALFQSRAEVTYAVYAGYSNDTALFSENDSDGLSFGSDLRALLDDSYLAGISYYQQDNDDLGDRTEQNVMLYGQAELPAELLLRAEYLHQWRDSRTGLPSEIDITYVKLRWDFRPDAYANYRVNWGDSEPEDGDFKGKSVDATIHTFTLGYRPDGPLRIKLEFSSNNFSDGREDFNYWGVSVGYLF
ncbi:MAG: hypothetical protein JRG82_14375 [Deltaproteobacteria bacterium]|nr:hypothetical protein [Deltaproteobacteria bacterium]